MADSLQIRAGSKETMPTLADREPAYVRDEKAFYIGTPNGNEKIGDAAIFQRVTNLETRAAQQETAISTISKNVEALGPEVEKKLEAEAVASQAALADSAALADVISAYNSLIAAMQASGVMEQ